MTSLLLHLIFAEDPYIFNKEEFQGEPVLFE